MMHGCPDLQWHFLQPMAITDLRRFLKKNILSHVVEAEWISMKLSPFRLPTLTPGNTSLSFEPHDTPSLDAIPYKIRWPAHEASLHIRWK